MNEEKHPPKSFIDTIYEKLDRSSTTAADLLAIFVLFLIIVTAILILALI